MARLGIGIAGLLLLGIAGCGGSASPSASTAASVVATTTTSMVLTAPTPGRGASPSPETRWRVVSTRSVLGPAHLYDLTTFRGSLVAVGATDAADGRIWSSTDGEVWTSIAGAIALDGMQLHAVAVGDPGIVVVGFSDEDAVVLFSADGASWSRQQLPGGHPGSSAVSVAWGHGRYVTVGGGGEPEAAVAWTSVDGRAWTRTSIFDEGFQASLSSVVAGPEGFVADGMYQGHPASWASPDAQTWSRTDLPGAFGDDPQRLRYTGGRFFLPNLGGVRTSTDGQRWIEMAVPGFGNGVFDVAAIPGGFVAVGRSSEGRQPGVVATADGDLTRWTLQPADAALDGAIATSILVSPDGENLVAVGNSLADESVFLLADPSSLLGP